LIVILRYAQDLSLGAPLCRFFATLRMTKTIKFIGKNQNIKHKKGRKTLAVRRPTSTYENNPFWKGYKY